MLRRIVLAVAVLAAGSLVSERVQAGNPCCCPPAPIEVSLCVAPPCRCCNTTVCVCVPGCCTEAPTVCWKTGLLGRSVGTYTWPCCGHEVKVVVTRRGEVKVRG
jgi:hypothetical protein